MKKILSLLVVAALFTVVGCGGPTSPTGKGPDTKKTESTEKKS